MQFVFEHYWDKNVGQRYPYMLRSTSAFALYDLFLLLRLYSFKSTTKVLSSNSKVSFSLPKRRLSARTATNNKYPTHAASPTAQIATIGITLSTTYSFTPIGTFFTL